MSIFECKALTKNYGAKTVLDSIDLTIEPGRIVGLLGPNGSGKTTLIKLANGLLTPTSGEILIAGKAPCRATKAIVSYLPDRNTLPGWMSIAQALDYYGDFYLDFRRGVAEAMLMNLGLDRTQKIKTLSKGMREKTQRPSWSVPSQYSASGGANFIRMLFSYGSCGAIHGAKRPSSAVTMMMKRQTCVTGLRRKTFSIIGTPPGAGAGRRRTG